jgi:damage-control phosphatase, subfamily I
MTPIPECGLCLLEWVHERAKVNLSSEKTFELVRAISHIVSSELTSTANLASISNKITDSVSEYILCAAPHYDDLKQKSNQAVKDLLADAIYYIDKSANVADRLIKALSLATVSNIAPIGKPSSPFTFQDARQVINGDSPPLDISDSLLQLILKAQNILYIADNAGEIGFDSLFISELKRLGVQVYLVVKAPPFFEDATIKDAEFFSLDKLVDGIFTVNGFFIPSRCDGRFAEIFMKSDLVISKGTGNYEATGGETYKIPFIHMLKVKCLPITHLIKEKEGHFVAKLSC